MHTQRYFQKKNDFVLVVQFKGSFHCSSYDEKGQYLVMVGSLASFLINEYGVRSPFTQMSMHTGQDSRCKFTSKLGSGCGSVGRAVASNIRGPRFKSSHRQKFIYFEHLFPINCVFKRRKKIFNVNLCNPCFMPSDWLCHNLHRIHLKRLLDWLKILVQPIRIHVN